MEELKIKSVVLKSGKTLNVESAIEIKSVLRNMQFVEVIYEEKDGESIAVPKERLDYVVFVSVEFEDTFFEIRESEIAGFEYIK